jgi:hypothetical protein
MNIEEVKQRLIVWTSEEDDLDLLDEKKEGDGGFVLTLRTGAYASLTFDIKKSKGREQLALRHSRKVPKTALHWETQSIAGLQPTFFADVLERLIEGRAALLRGEIVPQAEAYLVTISYTIYLDGLSKHVFLSAVDELAKTSHMIDRMLQDTRQQEDIISQLQDEVAQADSESKRMLEKIEKTSAAPLVPMTGGSAEPLSHSSGVSTRKCSRCGESLPAGARFCAKCGKDVEAATGSPLASAERRCPRCGKTVRAGKEFCTSCGLTLT